MALIFVWQWSSTRLIGASSLRSLISVFSMLSAMTVTALSYLSHWALPLTLTWVPSGR